MRKTVNGSELFAALALAGCGGGASDTGGGAAAGARSSHPGTDDGAKALLAEFVEPGAD